MSARSLQQQLDVFYLLASKSDLSTVQVVAEARGVSESEVDKVLGPRRVRNGKKNGLVIIVSQPSEKTRDADAGPILITRRHVIRVIEAPEINRKSGGTGITADLAKDLVMQRLHQRYLGKAALLWIGNEPWIDDKGGYGWQVAFDIVDDLASEQRAATPIITIADGQCTIAGAGLPGEAIYYTINGNAPVPTISGVQTYAGPFAVGDAVRVRASTTATGYLISDFAEETSPTTANEALTGDDGEPLIGDDGEPLTTDD